MSQQDAGASSEAPEQEKSSSQDCPNVIMLPPILVLYHIVAGLLLHWLVPFSFGHAWGWAGLVALAAGMGVIIWSKKLFDRAETNLPPSKPTLSIVKDGPYKFSRNPIYLSFLLCFFALAAFADAPMMLAMLIPLFYFLDQRIIEPEEEYLLEKFGDEYFDYQVNVRRWL